MIGKDGEQKLGTNPFNNSEVYYGLKLCLYYKMFLSLIFPLLVLLVLGFDNVMVWGSCDLVSFFLYSLK